MSTACQTCGKQQDYKDYLKKKYTSPAYPKVYSIVGERNTQASNCKVALQWQWGKCEPGPSGHKVIPSAWSRCQVSSVCPSRPTPQSSSSCSATQEADRQDLCQRLPVPPVLLLLVSVDGECRQEIERRGKNKVSFLSAQRVGRWLWSGFIPQTAFFVSGQRKGADGSSLFELQGTYYSMLCDFLISCPCFENILFVKTLLKLPTWNELLPTRKWMTQMIQERIHREMSWRGLTGRLEGKREIKH